MTIVNIKCPYCDSEGHTDDEGNEMFYGILSPTTISTTEMLYGHCKNCGKEFGWNSVTNKATKEESK